MLSRDLKGGPRNHAVDSLADDFGNIGNDLLRLKVDLAGRSALPAGDIDAVETLISRTHAALDRASTTLTYVRPALTTRGADNEFMGRHARSAGAMEA